MARLPDPHVRQRWTRLIQLHQQSDLTIADFCDVHDISTASFYWWRRKLRSEASGKNDRQGEFLAVEIKDSAVQNSVTKVHFSCGTQIDLDSSDTQGLRLVLDRLVPRTNETAQ